MSDSSTDTSHLAERLFPVLDDTPNRAEPMEKADPTILKLSHHLLQRVVNLLNEPILTNAELIAELDEYLATARRRLPDDAPQRGLVESMATRLLELLNSEQTPFGHQLAQAALRYLVLENDEQPDFDSPQGLDDDTEVFNAVAERLGRADLQLPLR